MADMQEMLDMLQQQRDLLRAAKSRQGQQPTKEMKRSREQLMSEYGKMAMRVKMMASMNQCMMTTTHIGEAYEPCTTPLAELQSIYLKDLRLETHHRGSVLWLRSITEPSRMTSIGTAVEDAAGEVDRLAVYNLLPSVPPESVLRLGAIVAVKEPYYKICADGGVSVRVDHPSDLMMLEPYESCVPAKWRVKGMPSAAAVKEDGNRAFKAGDWARAARKYTEALNLIQKGRGPEEKPSQVDELRKTLFRNRSGALLRLGHYEPARDDALASLIPDDGSPSADSDSLNIKALFRAGKAAYGIGDFAQARKHYESALKLAPSHKETVAEMKRTDARLTEEQRGEYDFEKMYRLTSETNLRRDHASFIKNVKVAPSGDRGRGLFATKDLKAGDIVLVEKAFVTAFADREGRNITMLINVHNDRAELGTHAERFYRLVDKMLYNPSQATAYFDLFDGGRHGAQPQTGPIVDGKAAIDIFRVQSIAELNGFGCPAIKSGEEECLRIEEKGKDPDRGTGMWLRASYANHSCLPNTCRAFIGDIMIVRAVRDIKTGEEIFTPYCSGLGPYADRQKHLERVYKFKCECVLCAAEAEAPAAVVRERAKLVKQARRLMPEKGAGAGVARPASVVKTAMKLLGQIRETYDPALFARLPRLAAVELGLWLVGAIEPRPSELVRLTESILRDLGNFVTIKGERLNLDRSSCFQAPTVIHAAAYSAQAAAAMGKAQLASEFIRLAREVHVMHFASVEGFDKYELV